MPRGGLQFFFNFITGQFLFWFWWEERVVNRKPGIGRARIRTIISTYKKKNSQCILSPEGVARHWKVEMWVCSCRGYSLSQHNGWVNPAESLLLKMKAEVNRKPGGGGLWRREHCSHWRSVLGWTPPCLGTGGRKEKNSTKNDQTGSIVNEGSSLTPHSCPR